MAAIACAAIACGRWWRGKFQAVLYSELVPSLRGARATKQSSFSLWPSGLLRGACHRAALCASPGIAALNDGPEALSGAADFYNKIGTKRTPQSRPLMSALRGSLCENPEIQIACRNSVLVSLI